MRRWSPVSCGWTEGRESPSGVGFRTSWGRGGLAWDFAAVHPSRGRLSLLGRVLDRVLDRDHPWFRIPGVPSSTVTVTPDLGVERCERDGRSLDQRRVVRIVGGQLRKRTPAQRHPLAFRPDLPAPWPMTGWPATPPRRRPPRRRAHRCRPRPGGGPMTAVACARPRDPAPPRTGHRCWRMRPSWR